MSNSSDVVQILAMVGQHVAEEIVNSYDVLSLERRKVRTYCWYRKNVAEISKLLKMEINEGEVVFNQNSLTHE